MDFNGMVRHYLMRRGSHVADIRVNLADKDDREQQSHEMILRIRNGLTKLAESHGANIKLVEVPPGPPVLATITAEVYGPDDASYDRLIASSHILANRLKSEPGVVDVDISVEDDQTVWKFETDKPKAALSGISMETIAQTLKIALGGLPATVLHLPKEVDPLTIQLRLHTWQRSAINDLEEIYVRGDGGQVVQLGALGEFKQQTEDKTIYHKNLKRVAFVYAEVASRTRPILLTAGTTLLGNWGITIDPIFSGLAWSIIFGIVTSTLFTLIVIPVVYWMLYGTKPTAGEASRA